jgi:hypothetical protein
LRYFLNTLRTRWWAGVLAGLLAGVALGHVAAHYDPAGDAARNSDLGKRLQAELAQRQGDLDAAQVRVDTLQGKLAVEEGTRKSLEATLRATQQDLGRARDQLAFYNQLLPPGPNGSISIRALDVEQHGATLHYKVLLMRNAPGDDTFNGYMEFMANGSVGGKSTKIRLEPAMAEGVAPAGGKANATKLALDFDQFQRGEGVLSVPPGFIAKTITLDILEGKVVRVSRTVNLLPAH